MTDEEIKDKFRRLSILTLDRVQAEQIIEKVYALEEESPHPALSP